MKIYLVPLEQVTKTKATMRVHADDEASARIVARQLLNDLGTGRVMRGLGTIRHGEVEIGQPKHGETIAPNTAPVLNCIGE